MKHFPGDRNHEDAPSLTETLADLTKRLRRCRLCEGGAVEEPNPVFQLDARARIGIFGQAPGNLAHQHGRPFLDPSGDRLRDWLNVDKSQFYDPSLFAVAPMAFCFPGYEDKGGDRPPPKVCAETWRAQIIERLPALELVVLVGGYAQAWHLGAAAKPTLTATVANWRAYRPRCLPTPHPSWRNNGWLKKNPWFEAEVLPYLRRRVARILGAPRQ